MPLRKASLVPEPASTCRDRFLCPANESPAPFGLYRGGDTALRRAAWDPGPRRPARHRMFHAFRNETQRRLPRGRLRDGAGRPRRVNAAGI